jgi:hypothetical protein
MALICAPTTTTAIAFQHYAGGKTPEVTAITSGEAAKVIADTGNIVACFRGLNTANYRRRIKNNEQQDFSHRTLHHSVTSLSQVN